MSQPVNTSMGDPSTSRYVISPLPPVNSV